jgi:UDP-N-acetylglucosamine:LPS N-acetylglucosamine transferase
MLQLEALRKEERKNSTFFERKASLHDGKTLIIAPPFSGTTSIIYDYIQRKNYANTLYIDLLDDRIDKTNLINSLYGYIDNIDEMMTIADLMLTKPGGLTVSEALAIGVPLLMFNPIPYQETNNAAYIAEKGAGVLATSIDHAIQLIQKYYASPSNLEKMRQNAYKIAKPKAAQIIVNTILKDNNL